MSSIQRITTAALANADVTRARYGSNLTCWLPVIFADSKPVTMGLHRSRRLRRPSP